jgi:hypothetical protein
VSSEPQSEDCKKRDIALFSNYCYTFYFPLLFTAMSNNAPHLQTAELQLDDAQLKPFLHQHGVPEKIVEYFDNLSAKSNFAHRILDWGGGGRSLY